MNKLRFVRKKTISALIFAFVASSFSSILPMESVEASSSLPAGIDEIRLDSGSSHYDIEIDVSGAVSTGLFNGCDAFDDEVDTRGFAAANWSITVVGDSTSTEYFDEPNLLSDCDGRNGATPGRDTVREVQLSGQSYGDNIHIRIPNTPTIFSDAEIIVAYTKPGSGGVADGALETFTYTIPASLNFSDDVRPAPEVTSVDVEGVGDEIRVNFSRSVSDHGEPSDYRVFVDGREYAITSSFSQTTSFAAFLQLESPLVVFNDQILRVVYQYTAGTKINDSVEPTSLDAFDRTRNGNFGYSSTPVATPPSVSSAAVESPSAGVFQVKLTFDEALQGMTAPQHFSVLVNGSAVSATPGNISDGGNELILTLGSPVTQSDTTVVEYTYAADVSSPNGTDVRDLEGATLADFNSLTATPLPDTTAPTVSAAAVSTDGLTLTVTFNEAMTAISAPTGFTVNVDGTAATVDTVGDISANGTTLGLTMSEAIVKDATVTVDYDSTAGSVGDAASNALATFSAQAVTNDSEVSGVAPTPPPYTGPIIGAVEEPVDSDFAAAGQETVVLKGERLGGVTRAIIDGKEAEILSVSSDSVEIVIPEDLAPGTYDVQIESSLGNLTYLDAITIQGSVEATSYGEMSSWTKRISETQVKVYVKFPTVGEKVRIGHQTGGSGSYETVYVKTTSRKTMDGLRIVEGVGTYIVRTIDLSDINRIRVTVGDEELVQVRYNN